MSAIRTSDSRHDRTSASRGGRFAVAFEERVWGGPVEGLSGPVVDLFGDFEEPPRTVATKVGVLGEVVPQQPIHVLVARPLPRGMSVTEVHRHFGGVGELEVAGHLLALSHVNERRHTSGIAVNTVMRPSRNAAADRS